MDKSDQRAPSLPNRRSIRLCGYDYTQSGAYFVTLRAHGRRHIFGRVENGQIHLSPIGAIADQEWNAIPEHCERITIDTYCVMPNHIHGIIVIHEQRRNMAPMRTSKRIARSFGWPVSRSLSAIVGSYKSGVTRRVRQLGMSLETPLWQSWFYDHIIRDNVDFFLIKQYIGLNPIFWEYDIDNPCSKSISFEDLEALVRKRTDIEGATLFMIMSSNRIGKIRIR